MPDDYAYKWSMAEQDHLGSNFYTGGELKTKIVNSVGTNWMRYYQFDTAFKSYVNTDLDPPAISKANPTAGRTDVSPGANVTATFDEAMRTKATKGTFTLAKKSATGTSVPIPAKKS